MCEMKRLSLRSNAALTVTKAVIDWLDSVHLDKPVVVWCSHHITVIPPCHSISLCPPRYPMRYTSTPWILVCWIRLDNVVAFITKFIKHYDFLSNVPNSDDNNLVAMYFSFPCELVITLQCWDTHPTHCILPLWHIYIYYSSHSLHVFVFVTQITSHFSFSDFMYFWWNKTYKRKTGM